MRDIRIACGQFVAEAGDKEQNIRRMIGYAEEARQQGCALILFPELIVTGYLSPREILPLAESTGGPSVRRLATAASRLGIAIAFGMAELDESSGACHNSLVTIGKEGSVVGIYRKMHLWADEKTWAEEGTEMVTLCVDGMRCGCWICYDTRFPETARLAALAGADVALVSTAWLGPTAEWELALCARALDNSFFVAGADIISSRPGLACRGASMIVGPKGNVLARAEIGKEGIIHTLLRAEDLAAQRNRVPLLDDRRPESYGVLTAPNRGSRV